MLILAGLGNGWLPASEQHTAGLLLAAFVFPLETIAVLFAFLARDTFGATGLGMFVVDRRGALRCRGVRRPRLPPRGPQEGEHPPRLPPRLIPGVVRGRPDVAARPDRGRSRSPADALISLRRRRYQRTSAPTAARSGGSRPQAQRPQRSSRPRAAAAMRFPLRVAPGSNGAASLRRRGSGS